MLVSAKYLLALSPKAMAWLGESTRGIVHMRVLDWMLTEMATKVSEVNIRGNRVKLERGQAACSVNACSNHFGIDRVTVGELYRQMTDLGLIEIVPRGRVTTLVNVVCAVGWDEAVRLDM